MDEKIKFETALPTVGATYVQAAASDLTSPRPPPGIVLTDEELQVYDYLCAQLRAAGIEHTTSGMTLTVTVKTWIAWKVALLECEEKGRSQTSKTGWSTPTPWADDEKRLKMELGQWLPKSCLTIPAWARVRKDTGGTGGQDDLFSDLVSHGTSSPNRNSSH